MTFCAARMSASEQVCRLPSDLLVMRELGLRVIPLAKA